ncbi:MAG: hypothetical protein LBG57_01605 [Treponema sp.]|jgi:tRNA G18 (ribose-2'-O)-methylase SpoU|nr:hypothetical protein [Treponema sp.]
MILLHKLEELPRHQRLRKISKIFTLAENRLCAAIAADASLGRVSIPCYGAKGSLNVSVAFGIVMQARSAALVHSPPIPFSFSTRP